MKIIKDNMRFIIPLVLILLLIIVYFIFKNLLYVENNAIYGDRLKPEDKVELSSSYKSKIEEKLKEKANNIKIRKQGKIISIYFKVNKEISREDAKVLGAEAINVLSDDIKKKNDIQVFVEKIEYDNQFPIIGYKNIASDGIIWTKDR